MYWLLINTVIVDKGVVSAFLKKDYVFIKKYMAFSYGGNSRVKPENGLLSVPLVGISNDIAVN